VPETYHPLNAAMVNAKNKKMKFQPFLPYPSRPVSLLVFITANNIGTGVDYFNNRGFFLPRSGKRPPYPAAKAGHETNHQ